MVLAGDEHAEDFSVHIHFVDFPRSVTTEHILWGRISDAEGPRSTDAGDALLKVQIVVINLDSPVSAVSYIDVVLPVRGNAMRGAELILFVPPGPQHLQPMAVRRNLHHARVAVAVGHEDIALRIKGHIGFAIECPLPARRMLVPVRRIRSAKVQDFEVSLEVINGLRRPAKPEHGLALRVILDDHAGALVNLPYIVLLIYADGVCK